MENTPLLFTTDKKRLLRFFQTDPVLYSYHIGDLDDFYFNQCQWAVSYGENPRIQAVVLIYHGLSTPSVLAFGQTELFNELLKTVIDILPSKFYCHFQNPMGDLFKHRFKYTDLGKHQKMRLEDSSKLASYGTQDKAIRKLESSDESVLLELYSKAYPGNYFDPFMLATGKYLGWFENRKLCAVAGVHVHSDEYQIAVLGNITTDPDFRGRGLATKLTGTLCHELAAADKLICLNVKTDNLPAIKCYEKLGFVKVHEYQEALFER